jgi:hypothetical protein
VATIDNEFPLARASKRFAAFALVGAGLFAAPLLAERITLGDSLGDAAGIGAIAGERPMSAPAPVAASRRIDMAWEQETRRSRDMAERMSPPARLDRIPPRIMLALR